MWVGIVAFNSSYIPLLFLLYLRSIWCRAPVLLSVYSTALSTPSSFNNLYLKKIISLIKLYAILLAMSSIKISPSISQLLILPIALHGVFITL